MSLMGPSEVQHYFVQGLNGPTLVSTQPAQLYTTTDQTFLRQNGLQKVLRVPTMNAPHHALVTANGQVLQGVTASGQLLQGVTSNGQYLQGVNGQVLQGVPANGQLVQGITANGQLVQGITANGQIVQGITSNGQVVRGVTANGQGVTIALDPGSYVTAPKYVNTQGRIVSSGLPIRPAQAGTAHIQTVRQVPTFMAQGQQQVLTVQGGMGDVSNGFSTRLANGTIVSSNVTSAAAAAALATTNQFAQNRANAGFSGRALLPMQSASNLALQQQGRPAPQQMMQGVAVRPAGSIAVRPANAVYATPAGATVVRPAVRIPKLGTVATYNPATGGLHTSPSNNGLTVNVVQGGMQAQVQRVLQAGMLQSATAVASQPHQVVPSQQQLLATLRARVAALNNARAGNGLVVSTAMPGRVVNIVRNDSPTGGTVVVDDNSLLSRLLEAQARSTVVKVPASSQQPRMPVTSGAPAVSIGTFQALGMHPGGVKHALPDQQALLSAQNAAMNLTQTKMPARSSSNVEFVEATYAPGFKALGNGDPRYDGLAATQQPLAKTLSETNSLATADAMAVLGSVPRGAQQQQSFPKGVQDDLGAAANGNKEDLKVILACIGVELARHGISVDAAVSAGWLGVLSQPDLAVLAEAYSNEVNRLNEEQGAASTMHHKKSENLLDPGMEDISGMGDKLLLDNAQEMFLTTNVEEGQFDAFSYGFFGDSGDDMKPDGGLLEALEPDVEEAGKDVGMGEEGEQLEPNSQVGNNILNVMRPGGESAQGSGVSAGGSNEIAARFANLDLGCGFF